MSDKTETPLPATSADVGEIASGGELAPLEKAIVPAPARPPLAPAPRAAPARRRRWRAWAALVVVIAAAAGAYAWRQAREGGLPSGIVFGNGRIVADEIDIDTKFAGRIAAMLADEGDMVGAGQTLARMDTQDLEASLRKGEAQVAQAQKSLDEARANVAQQKTLETLAGQEFDRTDALVAQGFATHELLDQRRQALNGAQAALAAAEARVGEAERALDAATHDVELTKVNIADNTLVAPREGRIQYRLANLGEVLPAGGKVFAMLDTAYVYMDVYLPVAEARGATIGADARIVLDARPDLAIPAKVDFVATQAQFTPQTVDVKDERDKVMFRVRVRIDPERLRSRGALVRSGLPGVAYVKEDAALAWPARLQGASPR